MNKRGFFLAEETMKIMIAVICIGLLLFVLGKMYYTYTFTKDVQQAKDTLARIETEINSMKEDGQREIMIYSPEPSLSTVDYWILISFDDTKKPKFCTEKGWKNCLCFCKNIWVERLKTYESKCDETNVCAYFSGKELPSFKKELREIPVSLKITHTDNAITFG